MEGEDDNGIPVSTISVPANIRRARGARVSGQLFCSLHTNCHIQYSVASYHPISEYDFLAAKRNLYSCT
jgi:hypothetical protein